MKLAARVGYHVVRLTDVDLGLTYVKSFTTNPHLEFVKTGG